MSSFRSNFFGCRDAYECVKAAFLTAQRSLRLLQSLISPWTIRALASLHNDSVNSARGVPVDVAKGGRLCDIHVRWLHHHSLCKRPCRGPEAGRAPVRGVGRCCRPTGLRSWRSVLSATRKILQESLAHVSQTGTRERHLESLLQQSLRQLILVKNFPRCVVQIVLQVTATPANEYVNTKLVQASSV